MAHRPPKRLGSQQTLYGFFAKRTCASSAAQPSDPSLEENSDHREDPEIEVCSGCDLPQMELSEVDSDDDGGTVSSSDASQERLPVQTIPDDDVVTVTNVAGGSATQRSYSDAVAAAIGGASLSDAEKRNILGIQKPDKQTVLPSRDYPDSRRKTGSTRGEYFISKVHSDFKHTCGEAADHEAVQYHKDAVARMIAFLATDTRRSTRVDFMQSHAAAERIAANRGILRSVLRCLDFAARQGLALRGHRDDFGVHDNPQGNFLALVNFAVQSGNSVLKEHLDRCAKNATYMSKTTKNELLACMAEELLATIVTDVKASHYFAIQADEVSDVSGWEQLGLSLRYVKDNTPVEKLVQFVACTSCTGSALCSEIRTALNNIGVDEANCRAQGYDGAGAMAGYLNGCQKLFRDQVPLAHYFHCSSHQLN
ncbi:uncharacterized protein LOC135830742 [Sycon ciliatum]|uniref:uncharacterized protein LOC135830742 n=1 Tax=Sycon ciliatum TaxID=27933 RepID=UPI0031F5F101